MPTLDAMYDEAIELQQQGKLDEAVGKLHEILGNDPSHALAHNALSVFCVELNQHDEAVEHAKKVCELEADDPFSFMAMSLICQKAGRIAEAEQALVQARQAQIAAMQRQQS